MKKKWMALLLAMLLVLGAGIAYAEETITTTIDLVFDGKTYTDTVQVDWTEKYPVPEGGVKWDGTEDFIGYVDVDDWKVIDANHFSYAEGQIAFVANKGINFDEIEQLAAQYGARIVMYMAWSRDYVIELILDKSFENMERTIEQLKKREELITNSIIPHYVSYLTTNRIPKDPWNNADWDENNPQGDNWGVEAIRAISAWNYSDIMSEMNIGIIDCSYESNHCDIDYKAIYYNADNENDSHGTHVTGTILAKHNTHGISGVFPKGKAVAVGRMNMHLMYAQTWGFYKSQFFRCIQNGAKIINHSQGLNHQKNMETYGYSDKYESAKEMRIRYSQDFNNYMNPFFEQLQEYGKDFLFVQAAGNDGVDAKYESEFSYLSNQYFNNRFVVVGAIGENNEFISTLNGRKWESSWGSAVDIVAPGENIFSTVRGNTFGWDGGTSMAAPHVTGVAAMIWSLVPDLTGSEVKQILISNGETIIAKTTGGTFRYPMLDAYACVQDALGVGTVYGQVVVDEVNGLQTQVEIMQNGSHIVTLITDKDGRFSTDLPIGQYELSVKEAGYNIIEKKIETKPGEDVALILMLENENVLQDKGHLICKVFDSVTRQPLNATITLIPDKEGATIIQVRDIGMTGKLEMDVDIGGYELQVGAEGYTTYTQSILIQKGENIQIDVGLITKESGWLNGYITIDSKAAANVTVKALQDGKIVKECSTDAFGYYSLLLPKGRYQIVVSKEGYKEVSKNAVIIEGIPESLFFELVAESPTPRVGCTLIEWSYGWGLIDEIHVMLWKNIPEIESFDISFVDPRYGNTDGKIFDTAIEMKDKTTYSETGFIIKRIINRNELRAYCSRGWKGTNINITVKGVDGKVWRGSHIVGSKTDDVIYITLELEE